MRIEKVYNKGQAQIFRNPYLEMLTKSHPAVIFSVYIPVIAYMLYFSHASLQYSAARIIFTYLGAIAFWTFFEYLAHRHIFHWISTKPAIRKFAYTLHGNHHEYPRDRQRLFMPIVPSLLITSVLFLLFYSIMRNNAFVFFPGFITGYLAYGSMHYAIHAWAPPFKWMKPLWRNHHLHHYKSDERGFGVSSTFWDIIFGTTFNLKEEKENKEETDKLRFTR